MAEIHASYRRTFQVKPYEAETVELSITDEVPNGFVRPRGGPVARDVALADLTKDLYLALADVGDRVVAERMVAAPQAKGAAPGQDPAIIPRGGAAPW